MTRFKTAVLLAIVLKCSLAPAQETRSAGYTLTVKHVATVEEVKFVGQSKNRSDKAPVGKLFLVVDITIQMSDLKLWSKFQGKDCKSFLSMVTVTSDTGEVFVASGAGFDSDHTCSGDDCGVFIQISNPTADDPNRKEQAVAMFCWGPQLEIKYAPPQILFDGRLVFPIPKELSGQPLKLQFQDVQLSVTSKYTKDFKNQAS